MERREQTPGGCEWAVSDDAIKLKLSDLGSQASGIFTALCLASMDAKRHVHATSASPASLSQPTIKCATKSSAAATVMRTGVRSKGASAERYGRARLKDGPNFINPHLRIGPGLARRRAEDRAAASTADRCARLPSGSRTERAQPPARAQDVGALAGSLLHAPGRYVSLRNRL